jgi:hypothetical protein
MAVNTQPVSVDAEDIYSQIRRRQPREQLGVDRNTAVRFYTGPICDKTIISAGTDSITDPVADGFRALSASLDSDFAVSISRLGERPPGIPTLRGYLGGAIIRILQGLLWWYTRSLQIFGRAVSEQLGRQIQILERLALAQADARAEIAALREEVRQLKEAKPLIDRSDRN